MDLRERVVEVVQDAAARAHAEQAELEGVRLSRRDNARIGVQSLTEKVRQRVSGIIDHHEAQGEHPGTGCNKRCFRTLSRVQAVVLPDALASAVAAGELTVDGPPNSPGVRYSRADQ